MHNLLHLLCGLPDGANVHNGRSSQVGAGEALHSRRHGGCEHDSLKGGWGGGGGVGEREGQERGETIRKGGWKGKRGMYIRGEQGRRGEMKGGKGG